MINHQTRRFEVRTRLASLLFLYRLIPSNLYSGDN